MSESIEPQDQKERKIAETIEELPPLKAGYIRLVHITRPAFTQGIVDSGLDYSKYGMVMSTARAYSNAEETEYGMDDPRYSSPELKAVVLDLPIQEHRLHENVQHSPGIVPSKYVVGVVPANQHNK